jgi:arsenate reductase (thioredoxin)
VARTYADRVKVKTGLPHEETQDDTRLPLVLILCTGNSCRSQMAEGFLKVAGGDFFEVASAGSKPAGFVHPLAIQVMAEIGIDISGHRSKSIAEFLNRQVETVITVCGDADEACPVLGGCPSRYHWPFDDPARAEGTQEEKLKAFREVRDQLRPVFEAYAIGRKQGLRGAESQD